MLHLFYHAQDDQFLDRPVQPCCVFRVVYPVAVTAAIGASNSRRLHLAVEGKGVTAIAQRRQNLPCRPAALPLPPVPGVGASCTGTSCVPTVAANSNNIEISAAGGDVTINTGTCGSVNPCDIVYALNALRQLA